MGLFKQTDLALRDAALHIFNSAVKAGDASALVSRVLKRENRHLTIGELRIDHSKIDRLLVIGAGKASGTMARSVEGILGDSISEGLVAVKEGYRRDTRIIRQIEAGHPVPDERGQQAAEAIIELAESAGAHDLVLCLLSGGGSALLPAPAPGITLADKQHLTRRLLQAGATINELNTVRKHLSRLKGGQLARLASPARVVSLILSDVIGDPLDVIASGPTAPDDSTYSEALAILERLRLTEDVPPAVRLHLERGARGEIAETPKRDDPLFSGVTNQVIGNNHLIVDAAVAAARAAGFTPHVISSALQGEAREVAKDFAALAETVRSAGVPVTPPACLIASGETTVTVRGTGRGGRCQEFCLSAAVRIQGVENVIVCAAGTDGGDGPTDAAGAIADGTTVARANAQGLSAEAFLENNDSYHFFSRLGDLVVIGPTPTNLLDLYLLLIT